MWGSGPHIASSHVMCMCCKPTELCGVSTPKSKSQFTFLNLKIDFLTLLLDDIANLIYFREISMTKINYLCYNIRIRNGFTRLRIFNVVYAIQKANI